MGLMTGVLVTTISDVAVGVFVGVVVGVTGVLVGIGKGVEEGVGVLRMLGRVAVGITVAGSFVNVGGTRRGSVGRTAAAASVGNGPESTWQPTKQTDISISMQ
jgi:hypothetical protein